MTVAGPTGGREHAEHPRCRAACRPRTCGCPARARSRRGARAAACRRHDPGARRRRRTRPRPHRDSRRRSARPPTISSPSSATRATWPASPSLCISSDVAVARGTGEKNRKYTESSLSRSYIARESRLVVGLHALACAPWRRRRARRRLRIRRSPAWSEDKPSDERRLALADDTFDHVIFTLHPLVGREPEDQAEQHGQRTQQRRDAGEECDLTDDRPTPP